MHCYFNYFENNFSVWILRVPFDFLPCGRAGDFLKVTTDKIMAAAS